MKTASFRLVALALLVFGALAGTIVQAPSAHAQTSVTGTADFRNAPQLIPGQYRDLVVSGDSAWYSVLYTNDDPYRFEVSIDGAAPSDVEVNVSFVAPTLDAIDGPSALVDGGGVTYPLGHTNVWFLQVSLDTTGQLGLEFPIRLSVEGVQDLSVEPCPDIPGCDLDEQLADINVAIADAQNELERIDPLNTAEAVEREMIGLRQSADSAATITRPMAESRLAQAEARIAQLCGSDNDCDEFPQPPGKTPLLGLIVGLAALGFGARKAVANLRAGRSEEDQPSEEEEIQAAGVEVGQPVERAPIAL